MVHLAIIYTVAIQFKISGMAQKRYVFMIPYNHTQARGCGIVVAHFVS